MFTIVIFLDVLAVNSLCALMKSAGNLRFCFVRLFATLFDVLETLLMVLLLLCKVWVLALVCALGGLSFKHWWSAVGVPDLLGVDCLE